MRETIWLGFGPSRERCAEIGDPNFWERAIKECEAFKRQFERRLPVPEQLREVAAYAVKFNRRDGFEDCPEAALCFDPDCPEAGRFAYSLEARLPEFWDVEARAELGIKYEVCPECGAVAHGNLCCATCREFMNERYGCNLPPWEGPPARPVGREEIEAFLARLDMINEGGENHADIV